MRARELIRNLQGRMDPSPYDIAWMARVPNAAGDGPHWPELLEWLIVNQWLDGSWGGAVHYYHDRILCTLASLIALKQYGTGQEASQAIDRAERYVWHNLHRLNHDPFELVGFELIFPTLIMEALSLGLDVPTHTCGYGQIRRKKLALIPPDLLYSPNVTTVHSLEFLGKEGDPAKMRKALAANGSLGNSPAATSYYILQSGDDGPATTYLCDMLDQNENVIYLYPCRIFELAWALHNLSFCHHPLAGWVDDSCWEQLSGNLSEFGIGLDPTFGIEDGDITSVTMRLLTLAGHSIDPGILAKFEKDDHTFRTYDYELNTSIGTNIHALETLRLLPDYHQRERSRDCILAFLMAHRIFDTYWMDKWHASPYYATAHVLGGIARCAPEILPECGRAIEWIIHTQREDGSWGFFHQSTAEETAYALIALLLCREQFSAPEDILKQGVYFLHQEMSNGLDNYYYPPLWLGKPLYVPHDIVQSSVLAALILYEETFGAL